MSRLRKLPFAALFLLPGLVVYGCSTPEAEQAIVAPDAPDADADHAHDEANHEQADGGAMTDMEKMEATLAKLPPEDHQSAMQQHFCPVSGEMLGTMGVPEKIEVEGKTVWICCGGCDAKIRAEPEKYLSKIGQAG
jgi:Cu(I)/Ag(I) efflux system membrane fusion protein